MKKILVVSDPEYEVGFDVLVNYCQELQMILNSFETIVLPIWPSGKIELIDGNKDKVKLIFKTLKELIDEFELNEKEGE